MLTFFAIIGVILLITFRDKIVSFFRGFNVEKEIKEDGSIVIGPYVITSVKIVDKFADDRDSWDLTRMFTFTFENGRIITKKVFNVWYTCNQWSYIDEGSVCSCVQKFNSKGLLVSERYYPIQPEHLCYRRWSCKPYYKN